MLTYTKNYFAGGNTAQGFVDFFESNLQGLERVYILKGGPGTGKSTLMKSIGELCDENKIGKELVHCSSDPDSLDAIIIPDLKFAVVDGTAPHIIEPTAPGAIEDYINLGAAWDSKMLHEHKDDILHIKHLISDCFDSAYKYFAEGLKIHDEWEKIYIANMDFDKANELCSETTKLLLKDNNFSKEPVIKHRFFGGSTPLGAIDFVDNITSGISKRYLLKGRPGTGKSTMLKKIASAAEERGIDIEVYHCGFDSGSVDMLLFPELDVCIFDSTAPHLYEPIRDNDEIIDMYDRCVKPGTDEMYEKEIQGITARYRIAVQNGIDCLVNAKKLHDDMEKYYIEAMDFLVIDYMRDRIIRNIKEILEAAS